MKAKVVARISIGLGFVLSFGLIYGNLNSSNILLDEAHRIQIIDFRQIEFEGEEVDFLMKNGLHKWISLHLDHFCLRLQLVNLRFFPMMQRVKGLSIWEFQEWFQKSLRESNQKIGRELIH
jgi:RIO-like serine/threonine protein kinase